MMQNDLNVVIGLEVHCQITKLKTKLFCKCSSDYRDKEPNQNVCEICIGLPGTSLLPCGFTQFSSNKISSVFVPKDTPLISSISALVTGW